MSASIGLDSLSPFLIGYSDKLSVTPGHRVEFKISSTFSQPYHASLIRIVHGDPNPAGPGIKYVPVTNVPSFSGTYPSRFQDVRLGSYGITRPTSNAINLVTGHCEYDDCCFTVGATIWPTLPNHDSTLHQSVLSRFNDDDVPSSSGFSLGIASGQGAEFILHHPGKKNNGEVEEASTEIRIQVGKSVRPRVWYYIHASIDLQSGTISVSQRPLTPEYGVDDEGETSTELKGVPFISRGLPGDGGPFVISGRRCVSSRGPIIDQHFNGKIERPFVVGRILRDDELQEVFAHQNHAIDGVIACWDFDRDIITQTVHDVGPHRLRATLVNLPTRGMKGSTWTGQEMCWRHAPDEYNAIHFHEDDICDCQWETDFAFDVPENMPSGVYGARIRIHGSSEQGQTSEEVEDIIPFYVRPRLGAPTSNVLFLAPTFTYQIYANHVRHNASKAYFDRVKGWPGARKLHPDQYARYYGASTYNLHSDGSGICYSSRLRPILTMRPGFLTFANEWAGSGLRHFPADTHLLDWLEAMGQTFDVVTDEDLDDEGVALCASYKVVLTGSHPEYHTERTLDALQSYVENGGRLMYLGGNGFYWRIARSRVAMPGVLEIRRAEGGIRAWAASPGEYYHSLDGSYGGLWRRNDRPPQHLVGVGFSSQGMFEGAYYVRTPDSKNDPRVSWIFENVDDDILGDFGLSGGGAAGFELDRIDHGLGTPYNTVVLASSQGHSETFIPVYEEMLTHVSTTTGQSPRDLVHSDMVFFETAGGGAVFSTGSITFCGSLSHNNFDNNISKIMLNVLTRFRSGGDTAKDSSSGSASG